MQPDDLYGLPLDRFVAERGALAKALRAEGHRDEAARVAKLRKPSAAAWAVNQLVRTQGRALTELFDAADALREAQAELLAGKGDARRLREAGARERAAVEGLVATARGLLSADGHELSETTIERVGETLHAAARDDAAREQVRGGCLERELRHVGLGLGEVAAAFAPAPAPAPAKRRRAAADDDAERRAGQQARAAAAAAAERQAARKRARAAVSKAAKREQRSGQALRAAQERRDRAAHALDEAEAALGEARAAAREAAEEHERARVALEQR